MIGEEKYKAEMPSGNLEDFLRGFAEQKMEYSETEDKGLDDALGSFGDPTSGFDETGAQGFGAPYEEEDEIQPMNSELAELSADFAAMATDLAIPSLFGMIFKVKAEQLQATKDQYERLVNAYASYLKTKRIEMSPGWMLVCAVVSIYATKIPEALRLKKIEDREKELDEREQRLQELENQMKNGNSQPTATA